MCGIAGVFHYDGAPADEALVRRQVALLHHRGPDDAGTWCEGPAALGQARLSIIDLSSGGHQPLASEDSGRWLVCNGEFYGVEPLRRQLTQRGHRFRGHSDSELALHLHEDEGETMLPRLRGMFAFALYERAARRLLLVRDRLGKKPLYYHDDGHRIVFASEPKALLVDPSVPRDLDESAIAAALMLRYVPGPGSMWRGIRALEPGHLLVCDAQGVRVRRYWSPPLAPDPAPDERVLVADVRAIVEDAVRARMVADVPVGALLSGGVDSACVTAMMAKLASGPIRTYTVGIGGGDGCEADAAAAIARQLGTIHTEVQLDASSLTELPRLIWQLDEPFADSSLVPTHAVARRAAQDVKVALSGDGGDEVFAGYKTYPAAERHAQLDWIPGAVRDAIASPAALLPAQDKLGARLRRVGMSVFDRHLEAMVCFPPRALPSVLAPELAARLDVPALLAPLRARHAELAATLGDVAALPRLDAETYLADDVLKKVDRAAMMHGLEVRSPLLDHELVERIARVPFAFKLRAGSTKWILKEAMQDLVPRAHLDRPKRGFGLPLRQWLEGGARPMVEAVLGDPRTRERGWIAPRALERVLAGDPAFCGRDPSHRQWTLMCLELWARTYVDRPREELGAPLA